MRVGAAIDVVIGDRRVTSGGHGFSGIARRTLLRILQERASALGVDLRFCAEVTDAVLDEVKAWQTRPLEELYPILYLDALVIKVRDGHQVRNRAAHLAVGVDLDGVKHVLGIWVQASEGAKFWAGVCAELRIPQKEFGAACATCSSCAATG
jgi:transposase-like protein